MPHSFGYSFTQGGCGIAGLRLARGNSSPADGHRRRQQFSPGRKVHLYVAGPHATHILRFFSAIQLALFHGRLARTPELPERRGKWPPTKSGRSGARWKALMKNSKPLRHRNTTSWSSNETPFRCSSTVGSAICNHLANFDIQHVQ